jgi:dihydrofolate reductase/thymidylate synthase
METTTVRTFNPIRLVAVIASTPCGGIGKDGKLPWPKLQSDTSNFHKITTSAPPIVNFVGSQVLALRSPPVVHDRRIRCNAVLMGRKTWQSLPKASSPLPGRLNIIVSRSWFNEAPLDSSEDSSSKVLEPSWPTCVMEPLTHEAQPDDQLISNALIFNSFEAALDFLHCQKYMLIDQCFVIGGAQIFGECFKHPLCQAIHWTHVSNKLGTLMVTASLVAYNPLTEHYFPHFT